MNISENSTVTCSKLPFQHRNLFNAMTAIRFILLLPLSTFIIYLVLQKWCQHHSFKTASHFDIFTYHLVTMEFLWVFGYFCEICTIYYRVTEVHKIILFTTSYAYYGEILFHTLICAERYIAVVLPVAYMRMKNTYGVRVRTISIASIWLLCFGISCLNAVELYTLSNLFLICLLGFAIIVSSYCSCSVLCALIRPVPGESDRGMRRVDQSKRRLFYAITAISSFQWLWFLGLLASITLTEFLPQDLAVNCLSSLVRGILGFCNLPCCLVIPVMYLHRAGKLFHRS